MNNYFIRTQCFVVQQLPVEAREALSRRLFSLHERVFTGISYEAFRQYVVFSSAWRTWLFVRYTPAGEWVGYTALHAFRKTLQGKPRLIFRMEMGSLGSYRGRDLTLLHVAVRMIRTIWEHKGWDTCVFSSIVHPSSYALAARYAPRFWPNIHEPTPAAYEELLQVMADEFHLAPLKPVNLHVREVGWITQDKAVHTSEPSPNPHVAFFLNINPTYKLGHGLLTIIPLKLSKLLIKLPYFLLVRSWRLLRRRQPI